MSFKVMLILTSLAVARAGVLQQSAVVAPVPAAVVDNEYDPNPQYTFGYDVHDPFTGDSKSQVESRSGDVVHGSYSLNDPDGTRRTVHYTADPINGFNAVVRKDPLVHLTSVVAPIKAEVTPIAPAVAEVSPVVPKTASVLSAVEVAPVASVVHSSSSVVHNPAPVVSVFPTGISSYSAPLVNHLTYSAGHLAYGYVNPSLYSSLSHYKAVHYV